MQNDELGFVRGTLDCPDAALQFDRIGNGPQVLLLHAGGERRQVWHPVMTILDRRALAAFAYDQRGHGESGGSRDTPLPLIAADTKSMIENLSYPVVVGASLGGFAALSALSDQTVQRQVAGLVLVDVLPDPDAATVHEFLDSNGRNRRHVFQIEDILARAEELRASAGLLGLPTLVVRAGKATPIRDADAERFRGLVPHAEFVTVINAGHLVARDQPQALGEIISDYLMTNDVRDRRISAFLTRRGGEAIPHPGGTLVGHLHRTADTLRAWRAPAALVDAGRLHAIYGTKGFSPTGTVQCERDEIVAIVGLEAEQVVDLYCRCDRARSYPTWETDKPMLWDRRSGKSEALSDLMRSRLMELTVANELDVLERSYEHRHSIMQSILPLFGRWLQFVSPGCREAILAAN